MTLDDQARLIFASLKGHIYRLDESSEQSSEESTGKPKSYFLTTIDEGLAAPFGLLWRRKPDDSSHASNIATGQLLVAHKPEILSLDMSDSGKVLSRNVFASGWGVSDDYHDWTFGIVQDSSKNIYVGLGSDYTYKDRPIEISKWRGDVLKIDLSGQIESIARGLRYPTGLAIDDHDRVFVTDQQGVQNTFNELNVIQAGHRYGVPSRHEPEKNAPADPPAVQIPHPWTRSVNGVVYLPRSFNDQIGGHFLACEHDLHFLVRMTIQDIDGTVQGAVYPFSKRLPAGDSSNFVGPLSIAASPRGELYVGSLMDGGWSGGLNMGDIVKLDFDGHLLNGLREIRATVNGFDLEFFDLVDSDLANQPTQYTVSGFARHWKGDYATPDSQRHQGEIQSATLQIDGRTVRL
ncbi:MAG: hypothetical protein FJ267_16425, partial [Planctomycetes bacterium]|nr:hypothetical protein [Planctomycetota bacterium]